MMIDDTVPKVEIHLSQMCNNHLSYSDAHNIKQSANVQTKLTLYTLPNTSLYTSNK